VGWIWRTSIHLATYQFPRSSHIFCAFCPVLSLFLLWTVLLGRHQDLWLCNLLSDGSHQQPLNEVVEALAPNILVQFHSLPYRGTSLHNTLSTCKSAICAASVKFSLVADWIHCRRDWSFRVIDLIIWKTCLEFPFAFAASNSAHVFQLLLLIHFELFCTSAFTSWYRFISSPFAFLFCLITA